MHQCRQNIPKGNQRYAENYGGPGKQKACFLCPRLLLW